MLPQPEGFANKRKDSFELVKHRTLTGRRGLHWRCAVLRIWGYDPWLEHHIIMRREPGKCAGQLGQHSCCLAATYLQK